MEEVAPGPAPPQGLWQRLRLFNRRWPAGLRHAHFAALCLLPLELITGTLLYLPAAHTRLIPVLPLIEAVHNWGGVVFCLLLFLPLAYPLGKRLLAVMDWRILFWLGAGLGVTGLALWAPGFGGILQGGAFAVHGILAVALGVWALYHGALRVETALRGGEPGRPLGERQSLSRRALLGDLGQAALWMTAGTAIFGWLQGVRRTVQAAAAHPGPNGAPRIAGGQPIPGFELYTVTGTYPTYSPQTWRLRVDGMVAQPLSLSLTDIQALPQVTETRTFHCVTGWSVPGVTWQGVRIADLLAKAQVDPDATWITFTSFDGVYTDSLSLEQAQAEGVILALRADGAPLAVEQGAPLRLLVPDMFGYKSVKWLAGLRLTNREHMGYWEQRGYGPNAYLNTINGWPAGQGGLGRLFP